ncbi:tyrosine-type recombinase/integrase [Nonomuraea basaltis]|uniref:tyrosine-type recombinase/integrase n=1 Tax=Nonomuraea basaltis TaxID=2495887 RepID=UPI00197CCE11|nr:site-specific integrase [Nonomuraea basaltis]
MLVQRVVSPVTRQESWTVLGDDDVPVRPIERYLSYLTDIERSPNTVKAYAMDLLRWLRFLSAVGVSWEQATPVEGRDFSLWIRQTRKPRLALRAQMRVADGGGSDRRRPQSRREGPAGGGLPGEVNGVTGKPSPGIGYAPRTVNHSESVLRAFYDFHREAGTGPMVNPFPLDRARRGGRAHAHHNPMDPWQREREGRYRSAVPQQTPRAIPEEMFELLFAALPSHRDRALVAFWISTGARAAELLGARRSDADPGQQLITVIRKGSRAAQALPASPDAFVWLRLYQQQMHGRVPTGQRDPPVVDLASAVGRAVLSRCAPDVRAGQCVAGSELDAA